VRFSRPIFLLAYLSIVDTVKPSDSPCARSLSHRLYFKVWSPHLIGCVLICTFGETDIELTQLA